MPAPVIPHRTDKDTLYNWLMPNMGYDAASDMWRPLAVDPDGSLRASGSGITPAMSSAVEASHIIKATPGTLYSLTITNTKASAQYVLVMDSATLPADGAVTLLFPPIAVGAASTTIVSFPGPLVAAAGIVVSNSSTGTFSKTIGSADCIFSWQAI